jgi:S1-C subfamily serine protease
MGKKLFLILIILLCLILSCCDSKNENPEPYDACLEIIVNDNIFCSGFFINTSGYILTSAHSFNNIHGDKDISLFANVNGISYKAMLISIDYDKDIALLKSDISVSEYINLDFQNANMSKNAYVVGNAYGEGIISTKVKVINENIKICTDTKSYQGAIFEGEIAQGLSGAPVLGENGNFLGMVIGKGANNKQMYAVSLQEINKFLKEWL